MLRILFILLIAYGATALPRPRADPVCGYESCPATKPGMINVHLIPHSHDDVGWLKTVDQYYWGSNSGNQKAGVQYIIDSVIQSLLVNPERRFIQVETAFFWMWWNEQTDLIKDQVRQLVNEGRLEFIGGAWSMQDEAATHYQSVIDQTTWGHRRINDSLGLCARPRVGWQIDPFGHARETASMMARMGFDGLFLGRIDYQDKNQRLATKTMEVIWEGSSVLGGDGDIFTNIFHSHYSAPGGFCFDINCGDQPIIDKKQSFDYNVNQRVDDFIKVVNNRAPAYQSDHLLILMGDDFQYQAAHMNFKNIDKLIRYVNERQSNGSQINLLYSTPSCYLKSVNEANLSWPTKQDDFFPYASDPHSYWTGYFTSRPTLKNFERLGNNFLQVCKQLATLSNVNTGENLNALREAMGIMQHHDAITGTEKQHVAEDYARILNAAFESCSQVTNSALNSLTNNGQELPALQFDHCLLRNISQCDVTATSSSFLVTIYNPLSKPVDHYVRVPVSDGTFNVRVATSEESVPSQIVPVPKQVVQVPGRTASTSQELVFKAIALPPLGYRSYLVSKTSKRNKYVTEGKYKVAFEDVVIGDENLSVTINSDNGLLKSIQVGEETVEVTQNFLYYKGFLGDNSASEKRSSGAYVFRPVDSNAIPLGDAVSYDIIKGDIVSEIHQTFSETASQVIRIYKDSNAVEFEWLVGPINVTDNVGKEIITRFSTGINSEEIFYTDSNGRETLERRRDYRPTWNLEINEPVSSNYYPVTNWIYLKEQSTGKGLALITDRAQGGSSMVDGDLELMVHRRLLHDDAFGAGEALDEQAYGTGLVARGKILAVAGTLDETVIRTLNQQRVLDSWIFLTDATNLENLDSYRLEFNGANSVPDPVQILTLEPWNDRQGETNILLRLENIQTTGSAVTVDLETILPGFNIKEVREMNLAANQGIDEVNRLVWKKESNDVRHHSVHVKSPIQKATEINVGPMEIKTFILTI